MIDGNIDHFDNMICNDLWGDNRIFPDITLFTPHIMVSLPRNGNLSVVGNPNKGENHPWTQKTLLYPSLLERSYAGYLGLDPTVESPFGAFVTLNQQNFKISTTQESDEVKQDLTQRINRELLAVNSNMALIEESVIARLNTIHAQIVSDIQSKKGYRKGRKTSAVEPRAAFQ